MRKNFENALDRVLAVEGGYSNHAKDPGGPTNRGVTLATFSAFKRRPCSIAELRSISELDVSAIYKAQYWDAVKGDDLPAGLDYVLFDYAVNSGPGRAVRELQHAVGIQADGVMGAMTMQSVKARDPAQVIAAVCAQRLAFLKTLKTWRTFGNGWSTRIEIVRTAGLAVSAGLEGGAIEMTASAGKAREQDVSQLRTPEGRAKIVTAVGAIGACASQVAGTIEPLAGQWSWVGAAAVCLAVVGVIAGIVAQQLKPNSVPEVA